MNASKGQGKTPLTQSERWGRAAAMDYRLHRDAGLGQWLRSDLGRTAILYMGIIRFPNCTNRSTRCAGGGEADPERRDLQLHLFSFTERHLIAAIISAS